MRRKDREVLDSAKIIDILRRSNTIRVGMYGGEYPYIVPVSFGMEITDGNPVIYFHCAKQGLKTELLAKNANICVEADTFWGVQKTDHGITTRYESIIGFGKCEEVESQVEITRGLTLLLNHYRCDNYPLDRCKEMKNIKLYRITLKKITGKENPVE